MSFANLFPQGHPFYWALCKQTPTLRHFTLMVWWPSYLILILPHCIDCDIAFSVALFAHPFTFLSPKTASVLVVYSFLRLIIKIRWFNELLISILSFMSITDVNEVKEFHLDRKGLLTVLLILTHWEESHSDTSDSRLFLYAILISIILSCWGS